VKRFLIANKLGEYSRGLADMGLCSMEELSEVCDAGKAAAAVKFQAPPLQLSARAAKVKRWPLTMEMVMMVTTIDDG
jgi:hypothetical protein